MAVSIEAPGCGTQVLCPRQRNNDWTKFALDDRVATTAVYATQDRVVDEESAKLGWGNRSVKTIFGKGHVNIVKPDDDNDDAFRFLVDAITS